MVDMETLDEAVVELAGGELALVERVEDGAGRVIDRVVVATGAAAELDAELGELLAS